MRLGKNQQAIIIALCLLFSASATGQIGKSFKYRFNGDLQRNDVLTGNSSIVINYSISELNLENFTDENGTFFRITIPEHGKSNYPGKPEVPVFSRIISIPEGVTFNISIRGVKSIKINPGSKSIDGILYPAQEGMTKEQQKKPPFSKDKAIYSQRGIISDDTVSVEYLGKVGSRSLANLYISPVKYNPRSNNIEVITSMLVEVTFITPSSESVKSGTTQSDFSTLSASSDKGILDGSPTDLIPGFSDKPVRIVIITDTAFKKGLEPFYKWKTQKGFNLDVLYKGATYAGITYTQLKESLNKIWNTSTESNPIPQYLLIIGDVNRIPTNSAGTDMYYGEFTGSGDYIPDMYVGRLPVADTSELRHVINKLIQYEKFAFADTNTFYERALVTAGNDGGYATHMNGQVNYAVNNYLTTANKINEYHFNYPLPSDAIVRDSLKKLINFGVSFINYTGHGASDGWITTSSGAAYFIRSTDVALFSNKNMYPLVISNACRTAAFSSATSLGNKMVLTDKAGAIGFIGCSNDSYWDEDYYWAVGFGTPVAIPNYAATSLGAYDRLFHTHGELASDWRFTLGQINFAGNMAVSASTSSRKKYYWETYNVIGDPSMIPILGKPSKYTVQIPDTLPNGIKTFSLSIDPFSYVAISHFDTLWDAAYASPAGTVMLDMPGLSNDSCLVVITGQNHIPLIKTVHFGVVNKEYINLNTPTINDIQGNNNGRADFGETIFLNLDISNLGVSAATGLYAKIKSTSGWITMNSDSVFIGTLNGKSAINLPDKLGFTINSNTPDNQLVTINILIKDNLIERQYNIDVKIHAPVLKLISCLIDDSALGNNNHIADQGESFYLVFKINNSGSSDASGNLELSTLNSEILLLQPSVKSGVLRFGEVTDIPIQVKLADGTPNGTSIKISSLLDCSPFTVTKDFSFRTGRVSESFEASSFNIFPWFNQSTVPWTTTSTISYDGALSAKSGAIGNSNSSTLMIKTLYSASDSLRFYYKVSSEAGYDFLIFKINGTEIFKKSGEVPWTRKAVFIPSGLNTFEWTYKKDQSVVGGADCSWLDLVDFAGSTSVTYIQKDLKIVRILEPINKDSYGLETITVKVFNTGRDVLNGFNLAYRINNQSSIITEHFDNQVSPSGDSVTVSFTKKADLTKYGIYKIYAYGINNNDDYLVNDTARVELENMKLADPVIVFPNPFTDQITVYINSKVNEEITISFKNLTGITLYSTKRAIISGRNMIQISGFNLKPSLYYLNVKGNILNKTISVLRIY